MSKKNDTPYKKGDVLTADIIDMGINGEGIGKVEGYTLFIKDAVIGDIVRVSIMKADKNYAYAHLDEVLVPSDDRVTPVCPKARSCGGCQLQALSYPAQLKFKYEKVKNALIRIGGFDRDMIETVMEDIVGMDTEGGDSMPKRYRGKAQFPVGRDRDRRIVTGFYAGHSHNIIPIDDCIVGAEEYSDITRIIRDHMRRFDIAPYDESSGTGLVRHILIRKGYATGQLMVCLVLNRGRAAGDGLHKEIYLTGQDELIGHLAEIQGMTSVSVNLNTGRTNVIMGDETHSLWGEDRICDVITPNDRKGITYRISPVSFYQVNPAQTDRLYAKVLEYASLTGNETVWDLYCGIGTISLFLAKDAGCVYGVEIVPEAIEDARINAKINDIGNAEFHVGKAEDIRISDIPESADDDRSDVIYLPRPDVIVVDPPRKGLDPGLIDTILGVSPDRIVYVSCDPATLARDLRLLSDGGYSIRALTPVDMFPQSIHCEVACALEKTDSDRPA